jgi:hypothetical protein
VSAGFLLGELLKWAGIALYSIGTLMSLVALVVLPAPGPSRFTRFMRGSFRDRADHTPTGWRVWWAGLLIATAGFVLAVLSVYVLGTD